MKTPKILLLIVFISTLKSGLSQVSNDPYQNRIIRKHYSVSDLQLMETNYPARFNYVTCYYIHSFTIAILPCSSCPVIDPALIDVREFETYRMPNQPVTVTDTSRGFSITLISKRELDIMVNSNSVSPAANAGGVRKAMVLKKQKSIHFLPCVILPMKSNVFNGVKE
jgi:hypothetical protein